MKLDFENVKEITKGSLTIKEGEDGYICFDRFTSSQIEYFEKFSDFIYQRSLSNCSTFFEFKTTAESMSFDYSFSHVCTKDCFDVTENGLQTGFYQMEDLGDNGNLKITFTKGEKAVRIYFPIESRVAVKNVVIDGEYSPVKEKREKVLWLGDSISQGYGTFRPSHVYSNVVSKELGFDTLNQSISGYIYDAPCLEKLSFVPDKIIVALGTNHYAAADFEKRIKDYYEKLRSLYPDTPILSITPIWRGNVILGKEKEFATAGEKIRKYAEEKGVTVVDGFNLVPHMEVYYKDLLHPNAFGSEIYAKNLIKAIKNLNF